MHCCYPHNNHSYRGTISFLVAQLCDRRESPSSASQTSDANRLHRGWENLKAAPGTTSLRQRSTGVFWCSSCCGSCECQVQRQSHHDCLAHSPSAVRLSSLSPPQEAQLPQRERRVLRQLVQRQRHLLRLSQLPQRQRRVLRQLVQRQLPQRERRVLSHLDPPHILSWTLPANSAGPSPHTQLDPPLHARTPPDPPHILSSAAGAPCRAAEGSARGAAAAVPKIPMGSSADDQNSCCSADRCRLTKKQSVSLSASRISSSLLLCL